MGLTKEQVSALWVKLGGTVYPETSTAHMCLGGPRGGGVVFHTVSREWAFGGNRWGEGSVTRTDVQAWAHKLGVLRSKSQVEVDVGSLGLEEAARLWKSWGGTFEPETDDSYARLIGGPRGVLAWWRDDSNAKGWSDCHLGRWGDDTALVKRPDLSWLTGLARMAGLSPILPSSGTYMGPKYERQDAVVCLRPQGDEPPGIRGVVLDTYVCPLGRYTVTVAWKDPGKNGVEDVAEEWIMDMPAEDICSEQSLTGQPEPRRVAEAKLKAVMDVVDGFDCVDDAHDLQAAIWRALDAFGGEPC